MIKFDNVYKTYSNGVDALKGVDFEIDRGEFVFFVGASGAGKSTLIKLIMREEVPTEGTVSINEIDLSLLRKRDLPYLRRGIGIVFQDFKLLSQMTIFENVAFAMEIVGASKKEIKRQVPLVLELMGLGKKRNCFPNQLSGGEQQRVSLARALVNAPSIIIADEPTGNLDPKNSQEIMKLLTEINKKGTTVLVTTHEKYFVDTMGKRVISIRQGNLVRDEIDGGYEDENE